MAWEDRTDRIDHHGPALIWQQVADDLAADIASAKLAPGSKLPAELELSELYGVARITVRRAITDLKERGLVVVVHGRGTFVAQNP